MTRYVRDPETLKERILPDGSTVLWRYLDLFKLISMLATGCLWFSRADTVGDPFEGSTTRLLQEALAGSLREFAVPGTAEQFIEAIGNFKKACVKNTAINCWHMSPHESEAMWRLYVHAGQGIVLRSTVDRLLHSFPEDHRSDSGRDGEGRPNTLAVHFGEVTYIDHQTDYVPTLMQPVQKIVDPFFLKRKSLEHEREFRAVIFSLPLTADGFDFQTSVFPDGGVAASVDLATLVESVVLSPRAPDWCREVVGQTIKQFGFTFPVRSSELDGSPIF